jgi:MFS family permease
MVLYGLVAGFAAACVAILGPILFGFVAEWIFRYLGWSWARDLTVNLLSHYAFFVVFGLAVGLTTCLRVWGSRLRREPDRSDSQ